MVWTIKFSDVAAKQFKKMNPHIAKSLLNYLEGVSKRKNPKELGKALSGDKSGLWRFRVNDHRIICSIQDKEVIILVLRVGHRKHIYE